MRLSWTVISPRLVHIHPHGDPREHVEIDAYEILRSVVEARLSAGFTQLDRDSIRNMINTLEYALQRAGKEKT